MIPPITQILMLRAQGREALRPALDIYHQLTPSPWGSQVVEMAMMTEGWGEQGQNNAGPLVEDLRRHRGPRGPWCAAAVSWWIEEGWAAWHGYPTWTRLPAAVRRACPVKRRHSARRLWDQCAAAGRIVEHPLPGDIALWARGREGSAKGHIAVVGKVSYDGLKLDRWSVWEGNIGPYPARCAFRDVTDRPRFLGWARLPHTSPLLLSSEAA